MSKATEYAADTRSLESEIAKVSEGTTDQILEYLALVTGGYRVIPHPPSAEGEQWQYTITFRAVNEELGVEFHATSDGNATTIRDAAIFATKGAIAWYQPWKVIEQPDADIGEGL